jgi:hypothetical protein
MSDFVIREEAGWHEITHMIDRERISLDMLWKAVGRKDWKEAESLIWESLYEDDEKAYAKIIGSEDKGFPYVAMIAVPDDLHGDFHRIWIRMP